MACSDCAPPLPPPGLLRPEIAHSAAGKCYLVGKVSSGTARLAAAAPGPLGSFSFFSPAAASRSSGRLLRQRLGHGCLAPPISRVRSGQVGAASLGPGSSRFPPAGPGAPRAYLCGPGRSRGRHPVV